MPKENDETDTSVNQLYREPWVAPKIRPEELSNIAIKAAKASVESQEPVSTEGKRQPHDWNELLDGPWNNGFLSQRITIPSAGAAPRQPVAKDVKMVPSTRDRKNRPPHDWNELYDGPWKPSE